LLLQHGGNGTILHLCCGDSHVISPDTTYYYLTSP
jgi:hypothetical protein